MITLAPVVSSNIAAAGNLSKVMQSIPVTQELLDDAPFNLCDIMHKHEAAKAEAEAYKRFVLSLPWWHPRRLRWEFYQLSYRFWLWRHRHDWEEDTEEGD